MASTKRDKLLSAAVDKAEDGTYTFVCPVSEGCGTPESGFVSTGWPTADLAKLRGGQHFDEHKGLGAMPELETFRAEHGLTVGPDHVVRVGDL